jgi:NADH-quinone oxidoreductase subunit F
VTHILLRDLDIPDIREIDVYLKNDGYGGLRKALSDHQPDEVTEVVKASGLRGRGGAGFPTGVKWSFVPKDVFPKYVMVNADESEPGTFKDRQLLENNPHQVIEGALIAAYAIQAKSIYVYCRGEFWDLAHGLEARIAEARKKGFLGPNILKSGWGCEMVVHLGAGAYICGEETALLSSLEGYRGQPRLRPPFPASKGLYAKPTVVNNVETLANVPYIMVNGAEGYRRFGTEKSPGPKIFSLSGRVKKPGNYELPLGSTLRELIYECGGGIIDDRAIKAILPAGASSPMMPATDAVLDAPMTYEDFAPFESSLGSASIIVLDETTDIVWAASKMMHFFAHESCGKCTPCREGCYWTKRLYERFMAGCAVMEDIDRLYAAASQMEGNCFCALGEFAINPVLASIKHFREDYEAYVREAAVKAAAD